MRVPNTVWQGCFGDWQPLFIREYWLPLGHLAWQGFLEHGHGMVVCEIHGVTATVDWRCTAVPYTARFVPQAELATCWQALNLPADQRPAVENAVATYDPARDAMLMLLGDSQPYISCLKSWAVPPPECSRQMGDSRSVREPTRSEYPSRNRQAEFTVAPKS